MNSPSLPRLSRKEYLILELLIGQGQMYGLEMVKREPALKRGTVYVTLARMADKGYVTSRTIDDDGSPGLPKRVFQTTGHGERVFRALSLASASLAGGMA
ncbi:MAG TPA: helix-turn-helix transcriptional regulator [Alphaproteobacteria bacterium]|nr:helix-turn-helix transcriptional regulator [Alphaproteobacteria bacterium]